MRPRIGFYVHHVGHGHLHRALGLAETTRRAGFDVTGLSSQPAPSGWPGEWVELDRDDRPPPSDPDPTANGRLHWAPRHHPGLCARTSAVSAWLARATPALLVVDVSVELAVLARLHGVPVISVVLPGRRDDPAHRLGFDVADELVGFWPEVSADFLTGLPDLTRQRVRPLGAMARFPVNADPPASGREALVLLGSGGHGISAGMLQRAREQTPAWSWTILSPEDGRWSDDPWSQLLAATVVVTHAGESAVAEVAAARRPAVVLPQQRPYDEQVVTAAVLRHGDWPVTVLDHWPVSGWADVLDDTAVLDGGAWEAWCDGGAAHRFAEVVREVTARTRAG